MPAIMPALFKRFDMEEIPFQTLPFRRSRKGSLSLSKKPIADFFDCASAAEHFA
jgi:hypothetical protein